MKKLFSFILLFMLGCLLMSCPGFAKTVSGKVTTVSSGNLEVAAVNPVTKSPENVSVSLSMTTIYSGVASAAEIQAGDKVWVETTQDSGPLTADSVKVSKG